MTKYKALKPFPGVKVGDILTNGENEIFTYWVENGNKIQPIVLTKLTIGDALKQGFIEEVRKPQLANNDNLNQPENQDIPKTNVEDSELRQKITDICFENGGVTKPMVDKIMQLIAADKRKASKFEIEQALIVAETEGMTVRYMKQALKRRLAQLQSNNQEEKS